MKRNLIALALLILWGAFLLPPDLWALTSNKDITIDDDSGDSPQVIMRDQDEKTLILQKLDTGEGNISNSDGAINIQPSTDTIHYLSLSTTSNLTGIYWKGHYTNDPAIRINSSGKLEYRDENESTWTTLDSLAGGGSGGTGDVTGPGSSVDNAIPRFDGIGGKTLKTSGVDISDARELMGVTKIGFAYTPTSVALAQIYQPADDYVLRTTANLLDRDVQSSYFKIVAGTNNAQDASLELYGSTAVGNEARVRIILPPVASAKGLDIIQGGGDWPTLMSIASTGEAVFNNMTTGNIATFHNTVQNRTTNIDQWGNLNIDTAASLYATKIRILGGTSPNKYTIFQGGVQSGDITYTLPVDDGTVGQVLRSDGSGVLSWVDQTSGAPTSAKYITQTVDGTLSAEQSLGALTTGILKNTTTDVTGVLSIAALGTDYYGPSGTDVAVADGGTGTSNGSITGTGILSFDAPGATTRINFITHGNTGTITRTAYVNEWGDIYTDGAGALYTNTINANTTTNDLLIDTKGSGDIALQSHGDSTGKVGVGTATPNDKLDVQGGSIRNSALATAGANAAVYADTNGTLTLVASDIRLKKDVTPITDRLNVLDSLSKLRGVYYYWNTKIDRAKNLGSQQEIGMIAQEVEKVLPEVVGIDNQGYRTLDYAKITAYIIEVCKAQQAQIEELKKQIAELSKKN